MDPVRDYHSRDGLFFGRLRDGSVRVRATGDRDITLPPNEWASVVASTSEHGEDGETYRQALAFHAPQVTSAT